MNVDQVKQVLMTQQTTAKASIDRKDMLSTGSTLLNMACTGYPDGGFFKGHYFWLVGDSSSGKTFLALTCLAEAARNPNFDNYRFILDDVEGGSLMNIERFFGKAVAERLESPELGEDGEPINSHTIEEFYYHLHDAMDSGKPCIYILDSMDALSSDAEQGAFEENKALAEKGKDAKGSYGDGKAKKNKAGIRQMLADIHDTKSIVIIISQTIDKLNAGPFEEKTTVAGGRSLKFFAALQIWSKVGSPIKVNVRGKQRSIGVNSIIGVRKNRSVGRDRKIVVPIYHSLGFDDVGGCVDYLVEEGHWKTAAKKKSRADRDDKEDDEEKKGTGINAKEFDVVLKRDDLIDHIEKNGLEFDLRQLVSEVWHTIESECTPNRKPRYV
jgi:RecA/RadA recombinase